MPGLTNIVRHQRMIFSHFQRVNAWDKAAALSFATLLSLVPIIGLSFWALSRLHWHGLNADVAQQWLLSHVFIRQSHNVEVTVATLVHQATQLPWRGLAVLALSSVWSMVGMRATLHDVGRHETPNRGLLRGGLLSTLLVLMSIALFSLLLTATMVLDRWLVLLPTGVARVPGLLLKLAPLGMITMFFFMWFKTMLAPKPPSGAAMRWACWTTLGLAVGKAVFQHYASWSYSVSMVYGSFSFIPLLLLWVYTVWLIILWGSIGCQLAAELTVETATS